MNFMHMFIAFNSSGQLLLQHSGCLSRNDPDEPGCQRKG